MKTTYGAVKNIERHKLCEGLVEHVGDIEVRRTGIMLGRKYDRKTAERVARWDGEDMWNLVNTGEPVAKVVA